MRLHPVILAGGRGERFWPLSRRARPKQLLPLLSERPMIADTLARLAPLVVSGSAEGAHGREPNAPCE
jgi:mannose-1-phosphate guanylyltransferase